MLWRRTEVLIFSCMYVCMFLPQEIARLNECLNQRLEVVHQVLAICIVMSTCLHQCQKVL